MAQKLDFIVNGSTTGPTAWFDAIGGRYIFAAEGNFGGSTLQLQAQGPNGSPINVVGAALSSNGFIDVVIADGARVRVSVNGGAPTGLYSNLVSVRA